MKKCPVCRYKCDGGMSLYIGEGNEHLYDIEDICPHCIFRMMQDSLPTMLDVPDEPKPEVEEVEEVYVFDESYLPYIFGSLEEDSWEGFNRKSTVINRALHIATTAGSFWERNAAENEPRGKQVIPYVICEADGKILAYERTKASGEGRLHNKWSVGVGGHINPIDGAHESALLNGLERELKEEFGLTANGGTLHAVGIIYDSSNEVGKVHFGIVYHLEVDGEQAEKILAYKKDDSIGEKKFITLTEALQLPNLENWSQLVVKGFA